MSGLRVLIVGGGVGGLALAAGLVARRVDAVVFEQAGQLRASGSGLSLSPRALSALDAMGVGAPVRRIGDSYDALEARSFDGRLLARSPMPGGSGAGEGSLNVHRPELLSALADASGPVVEFGRECVGVRLGPDGVTALFADGTEETGDVLVGADGAGSVVRRKLGHRHRRGLTWRGWQGISPYRPEGLPSGTFLGINGATVAGVYPLAQGRTGWFLERPRTAGDFAGPDELAAWLHGWTPLLRDAVAATPQESFRYDEIEDFRPIRPPWGDGRITILGDAAHAMLPAVGQGACQAIEDAAVLSASLAGGDALLSALRAYERQRAPRVRSLMRRARVMTLFRRATPSLDGAIDRLPAGVVRRMTKAYLRAAM